MPTTSYHTLCDDFYVSLRIHTKLDLLPSRESLLHLFESLQRLHPPMCRLRRRDDGAVVLEEPDEHRSRRFVRVDAGSLRIGFSGGVDLDAFSRFSNRVLEMAEAALSMSVLDVDNIEAIFGFDLEYRGNHDEIIAQTLMPTTPLANLWDGETVTAIDCQPIVGLSLSPQCDLQAYVEVKSRTSTYEVRTKDFESAAVSTYLTVRKYWGFEGDTSLPDAIENVLLHADALASEKVLPRVVQPLSQAIASRR